MARLKAKVRTGKAFRQLAQRCLEQVAENEAGAVRRDAEALHDMRVGVRRLRSVFTTFKPALRAEEVRELRDELHWLQGVLGRCRDWDVFIAENIVPLRHRLGEDERLQRFAELGARAREEAYDALEETVTTPRYGAVYDRLRAVLHRPESVGKRWMRRPVGKFARRAIGKRLKKISLSERDLGTMPLRDIHELRKEIKKARYAIGFFADLFRKKRAKQHQKQLALMQDLIGQMVDVRAGQGLIADLRPRKDTDRQALGTGRDLVTGWMIANSADCRERLRAAARQYCALKPLR